MTRAELIAKLREAKGPDRELFREIQRVLVPTGYIENAYAWDWWIRFSALISVEAWTDAALALVERVLPGVAWTMGSGVPRLMPPWFRIGEGPTYSANAPTLALAILIALLTALEAGETSHE